MEKPAETVATSEPHAEPSELERELHRWYGNLLSQLGPKVSPAVFATLDEGRLTLNRILNAARAAN